MYGGFIYLAPTSLGVRIVDWLIDTILDRQSKCFITVKSNIKRALIDEIYVLKQAKPVGNFKNLLDYLLHIHLCKQISFYLCIG